MEASVTAEVIRDLLLVLCALVFLRWTQPAEGG
jgi:hypothetical protein